MNEDTLFMAYRRARVEAEIEIANPSIPEKRPWYRKCIVGSCMTLISIDMTDRTICRYHMGKALPQPRITATSRTDGALWTK